MEADELVEVYTLNDATQAELIKAALQAEGISCEIDGENQGSFSGLLNISILVRAKDADRARRFIDSHEPHGE